KFAERLGYTTFANRSNFGLSLVLGGGEVVPLEHIAAFSAFAQDGVMRPTKAVLRVEDIDGNVLLDAEDREKGKRVMDKEVSRQTTDILSDNASRAYAFGESNYLTLGERPVGAKTGTTNDYKDAWTIGFTPSLVAGVWTGNADGSRMYDGASGSSVAGPIWNGFMRKALTNTVVEHFNEPLPVITEKPVLDGARDAQVKVKIDTISGKLATEFTPEEFIEEKGFGVPHSILYFIDKDDPRGPQPEQPGDDSQFQKWEDAILRWATEQEITMTPPPTEYDNVHIPENIPTVTFSSPQDNETVDERVVGITLNVQAKRSIGKVEYFVDDESITTRERFPFWGSVTIPNRFSKGFHTLSARVYDDVGNSAIAYVTINLTAEAGPIGVQWVTPWAYQSIYRGSQFPYTVKFTIDDPKSIKKLLLYAEPHDGRGRRDIGSISLPVFQNMSMQWKDEDLRSTSYNLTIEATLQSGDVREESITVYVR
ncbi:Ig-like domain-containing protein, partial [Patescibacteria group bacterium]